MAQSIGSLMVRQMIESYKQQQIKQNIFKQQIVIMSQHLDFAIYCYLGYYTKEPHLRDNGDLVIQGVWSEDWADISFIKTEQGYVATHVKQYYRGNLSDERDVSFSIPKELIDGRL